MRRWTQSTKGLRVHAVEGPVRSWKSILDLAPGARILETEGPAADYFERLHMTQWAEFHPIAFNDIVQLAQGSYARAQVMQRSTTLANVGGFQEKISRVAIQKDSGAQPTPMHPPGKQTASPPENEENPRSNAPTSPPQGNRGPVRPNTPPVKIPGTRFTVVTLPKTRSVFGGAFSSGSGLIGVTVREQGPGPKNNTAP